MKMIFFTASLMSLLVFIMIGSLASYLGNYYPSPGAILVILSNVIITGYQYKDLRAKCIKMSARANGGPSSPSVHA
jgi:hypothetical protein